MSQSQIDVCNNALMKIGSASITSLLDNSREARACSNAYDARRRAELRKHFWNFAMKRAVLAPDNFTPAFDFAYQFSLPVDCVRVKFQNDPELDWVIEGRKILTNYAQSPFGTGPIGDDLPGMVYVPPQGLPGTGTAPPTPVVSLNLRYVADITDCTQWDTEFYQVMICGLALDLVEVLTQSSGKKKDISGEYNAAVAEARKADAFETLADEPPDDWWWIVRQ